MSEIVVAPFSNSDIRDWPEDHYAALIHRLLRDDDARTVRIVGTATQRLRACGIVRAFDPRRVINDCGRTPWNEMVARLKAAACVIGNNSGVAHLAGLFGVPTVCVFGGSHQRIEWRPLGFNAVTVSRSIGCSPCHLDHNSRCPYDKACLREITPAEVAGATLAIITRVAAARAGLPQEGAFEMQDGTAG